MQIRYKAFIKASKGSTLLYEYIIWINGKWSEFQKKEAIKRPFSAENHKKFNEWLCRGK